MVAFCNWCVEADRLAVNPLARLCKADERSDRKLTRRALDTDELRQLLTAASLRPLAEYGRRAIRKPVQEQESHRTWTRAVLTPDRLQEAVARGSEALADNLVFAAQLERLGSERALIYKVMVLTGLRKGELASLRVGQLDLNTARPYVELLARDEKAGRGARIPLRADLVADIRAYLADRLSAFQDEALREGRALPAKLPADARLFVNIPTIRVFDADLAAAGIAKTDERGRSVDVHALRHTFGTHLSKAEVAPRTAQAAMRHSTLDLTMNVYTDPKLLDVAAAIDALPDLPLRPGLETERLRKTGTADAPDHPLAPNLAPNLAPTAGTGRGPRSTTDTNQAYAARDDRSQLLGNTKQRRPLSHSDNGRHKAGDGTRTHNNQLGRLEL